MRRGWPDVHLSRSSSGLGHLAFYQVTGVRLSYGTPLYVPVAQLAERWIPNSLMEVQFLPGMPVHSVPIGVAVAEW